MPETVWDRIVQDAAAPIFYRSRFLRALAQHPLYETLDSTFVVLSQSEQAVGVLPVYQVGRLSPITKAPAALNGDVWVSHLPHWYDSRWPSILSPDELVDSMPTILAKAGVRDLVLQNVGSVPLLDALRRAGFQLIESDIRYVADLRNIPGPLEWPERLGSSTRRNVRRAVRRAELAGWHRTIEPLESADLEAVIELCRRSSSRHGNPEWLPAGATAGFLQALGASASVVHEVRDHLGALVAAAVGFHDGSTYHSWSGGVSAHVDPAIDANLLLHVSEYEYALRHACSRLEGGRRSDELKQRLGMAPVQLYTIVVAAN